MFFNNINPSVAGSVYREMFQNHTNRSAHGKKGLIQVSPHKLDNFVNFILDPFRIHFCPRSMSLGISVFVCV